MKTKASLTLIALSFVAALGCTHKATQSAAATDTARATAMSGGGDYVVVDFEKGSHALSEADRQKLSRLNQTRESQGRKVDEIKVLAWADREYPADGNKATRQEVSLANDRAQAVKDYLKNDLHTSVDVDKHNMAERPGVFSEMMKTETYKTKTAFETTGAAPTEHQLVGNKASKAVVFVKYQ